MGATDTRNRRATRRLAAGVAAVVALGAMLVAGDPVLGEGDPAVATPPRVPLKPPAEFAKIRNRTQRSVALFVEAGKVLTHPRCVNCHPDGDEPMQGAGSPHQPWVQRGKDGHGVTGMRCNTCHQEQNFDPGRVPGAPNWHLAPREMAWEGKPLRAICEQLKDPKRNGNRTLAQIVEHASHDALVGWGWTPGADREPAPGDWKTFGALMAAWVETGARCPTR